MDNFVSEEFKQMCISNQVEVSISARPNPGDPFRAMRLLNIKSFSDTTVRVFQQDRKKQVHDIPAFGSVQLQLTHDEQLPVIERVN